MKQGLLSAASVCLALFGTSLSPAWGQEKCATYLFDEAHPKLILRSKTALWDIENKGPDDVVLFVEGEGRLITYAKGDNTVFVGDTNYTYSLRLPAGAKSAKVKVCPPVK